MACYGVLGTGGEDSAYAQMVLDAPGAVSTKWQLLVRSDELPAVYINVHADGTSGSVVKTLQLDGTDAYLGQYSGGGPIDGPTAHGVTFATNVYVAVQIDADGTAHAKLWDEGDSEPGWLLEGNVDIVTSGDYTGPTLDTLRVRVAGAGDLELEIHELRVWVDGVEVGDPFDDFLRGGDLESDWGESLHGEPWNVDTVGDGLANIVCAFVVTDTPGGFVDWGGDGFSGDDYDNIGLNIIDWVITRGSGAEITSQSNPGAATIRLKNSIAAGAPVDDLYNPRNAGGPLYGLLRDGAPIWIGVNSDGVLTGDDPRGLFGGMLTDISLMPEAGANVSPIVEFVCEDALGFYQRFPIRIDYGEGRSHAEFRLAALTEVDETRYNLDTEISTMPLSHADGDLRGVLDAINEANGTRHFVKPENDASDWYLYTTRNRQWRLDATVDASLDAGSEHVTGTDGWRLSADTVTNRQKATVVPVRFTPATFTVWQAENLPIILTEDNPYSVVIGFEDYVAGAAVDIASTGDTITGTFVPFATGAKLELVVAPGDEATVTDLSIEGSLAQRLPSESHEGNDTVSQTAPRGIREGSEIGNEYIGSLASATGIAEHVVWRYGDPQLRPTLTVENWFPTQFNLDLYDIISFTSSELGLTGRLFEIVGLTHTGNVAAVEVQHHVVTYVLQECKVQVDPGWFILDVSELDGSDILAY